MKISRLYFPSVDPTQGLKILVSAVRLCPGPPRFQTPNCSRLGVLLLGSPNLCGAPAGCAYVDKPVQFDYTAGLSLDFVLCSQKIYEASFKSTHAKWLAFEVHYRYDSLFDRLVWPDALRATGRLRAALSFPEKAF
mgnify:CR=1 FL=1